MIQSPKSPLKVEECKKLIGVLNMFSWHKKKESPIFLAGWIALARIAGALPIRPHVWLTGSKGAGKSMVINDLVLRCLGSGCTQALGGTTAAGLRQTTACDSRPIVFDEFESLATNQKQNMALMDLFRQSWSSSNSAIIKGSASGTAVPYLPNFSVLLAGIRVHFSNDADRSRFTVLNLDKHNDDSAQRDKLVKALERLSGDFGERLWSRSVSMLKTIKTNSEAFQGAVSARSSMRLGSQLGYLLAGYYSLTSDGLLTVEEAKEFIQDLDFEEEKSEVAERDEIQCLDKLLSSKVSVNVIDQHENPTVLHMLGDIERYGAPFAEHRIKGLQRLSLHLIGTR